jgi:hypothetical protein
MMEPDNNEAVAAVWRGKWIAWRHGGRRNDRWRAVRWDENEAPCLRAYEKLRLDMRQGGAQLTSPTGEVVESVWSPRVRSSW